MMRSRKSDVPLLLALLRGHAMLGQFSDAALERLIADCELVYWEPDKVMLQQGESSDTALFIVSGEADVLVETSYGNIQVARCSPKMLIGEVGAFTDLKRTATVRARTAVDALRIGRSHLLELGRENPKLLLFIVSELGERLSRLNQAIGFYTNALAALENNTFDTKLLDDLLNPMPELVDFSHSFLRLAEQITIKRQQFEEMANAAAIQRSMLPRPFTAENAFKAIDLYGELHPAREVGGDFFDYFPIDDKRLVITIGDVSGKGVPASLFMAIAQSVIRVTVRGASDLATEIARVNALLATNNQESMFATAFCAIVDAQSGEIAYCNCGHNAPLLLHDDKTLEELTPTGPPLAARANASFKMSTRKLLPGEGLVLFSDGLPEATNSQGEFFGDERVKEIVHGLVRASARELVDGIVDKVDAFANGAQPYDDIACVALIYTSR
ncbi:MAG TPA: SpoIIE family protein phosphatase [Pseudolabrys sp.]|nr:SpoIIE family protein phosphatase [Pseudolabrys sp.]